MTLAPFTGSGRKEQMIIQVYSNDWPNLQNNFVVTDQNYTRRFFILWSGVITPINGGGG